MAAPQSRRAPLSAAEAAVQTRDWSVIGLAGLLGARFFLPAESAAEGDSLWLVVLTLLYAAGQHFWRWRNGEGARSLDRVDWAMLALVGAHVLSSASIVAGSGQKRAAIHMAWEWMASLLLWFEFRKKFEAGHGGTLLRTVLTLTIVLAGYGIWQNQVWFRENAAIVNEWESLDGQRSTLDMPGAARLHQLETKLGSDFQSATGGAKRMLIDRIRSSTEPFGCFALANSLSGLLGVGLWLVMANGRPLLRAAPSIAVEGNGGSRWGSQLLTLAVIATLGVCLVMTKSRTAFLGVLTAGGIFWFVQRTGKWFRQGAIAAATVALAGMALLAVALLTGLIDAEVISEAPKSLRYRLEYWASTAELILDHVWLGCGPGNFRPNYLHHKLPGASEEILDPHNLLLDVWANAGVVAWAGLMALLIWGIRTGWKVAVAEREPRSSDQPLPLVRWSEGVQAALAGPALVALQQVTFGAGAEDRLWGFLIAAPLVGGWIAALSQGIRRSAVWGAWLTLTIHLCGAGGIAMPVIFQAWALLLACLVTPASRLPAAPVVANENAAPAKLGRQVSLGLAVGSLALAIVCVRTTLVPGALCRAHLSDAMLTMSRSGRADRALQQLIAAAESDPLNPEPWLLQMQLYARSGESTSAEQATEAGREAITRNPENPLTYELLGQIWSSVDPATTESRSAAIKWYEAAAKRYPNSARIRAALAIALHEAGQISEAQRKAEKGIRLDDRNQAAGHVDKVLPADIRKRLEQIVSGVDTSAPSSK